MAISLETLETDVYTTFYNHFTSGVATLSCISNVAQVTPKYSDNTAAKYGYPIIELGKPVIPDVNDVRMGCVLKSSISLPIVVVEDNATDAKTSCDDLRNKILKYRYLLRQGGLNRIRIVTGDTRVVNKNKKNYYFTNITVAMNYEEQL
jgi:hypothetical protein